MTVEATYDLKLTVDETVDLGMAHVADPEVTHTLGTHSGTLKANTAPPATKVWSGRVTLAAGSASLDLTNLVRANLPNVNFSGLKVNAYKLLAPSTNTQAVNIDAAATSGYNLFGPDNTGAEEISVLPGQVVASKLPDQLEDVDATHKTIDFTGTGTEYLDVILVAG